MLNGWTLPSMDEAQKQWSLSATEISAEPKGIPGQKKSTIALP